ncbi:hypothetical protein HZS_5675 [Henneguya salminicola]|nr:hypothetical protein HZS_5675 [Henneguya salminicola]
MDEKWEKMCTHGDNFENKTLLFVLKNLEHKYISRVDIKIFIVANLVETPQFRFRMRLKFIFKFHSPKNY